MADDGEQKTPRVLVQCLRQFSADVFDLGQPHHDADQQVVLAVEVVVDGDFGDASDLGDRACSRL
jgi:hypothetical protein